MDELKKFQKNSMRIAITGMGLSAMSGLTEEEHSAKAIGNIGKGLGTMANLTVMDTTLSMLSKSIKKRF